METHSQTQSASNAFEAQIQALLDRVNDQSSFVDRLMSMPGDGCSADSEWDRAVTRRLERRLSDAMRGAIEADRKSA